MFELQDKLHNELPAERLNKLLSKYTEKEQKVIRERLWKRPDSYFGAQWFNTIGVVGRSRDSDTLEESNFECAYEMLGGKETRSVFIERASHWAVGWVESLRVDIRNIKRTKEAVKIIQSIKEYPVLDDEHYCNKEWEQSENTFKDNKFLFERDLKKFLSADELPFTADQIDEFLYDVYKDSGDYSGRENAWVSDTEIKRYLRDTCYRGIEENHPILLACRKAVE
jgi:hypothetical protein